MGKVTQLLTLGDTNTLWVHSSRPIYMFSVKNLNWLSSKQALADLSRFVVEMQVAHNITGKWIALGNKHILIKILYLIFIILKRKFNQFYIRLVLNSLKILFSIILFSFISFDPLASNR